MRKSKLYSILLSVVIAFALYLYVVNNVSEEDDATFYNIPVVLEGENVLNERNLMITDISTNTVSLNLFGSRSDLNKVSSGNIVVKVDLKGIQEPGEKIPLTYVPSYPTGVAQNAFTIEGQNPAEIYVSVDTRRTREIPVQVKWTGTRSEDYIYDTENYLLDNQSISIVGPASVADLIHHAEVVVDLTSRTESVSESFRYTLCDENGDPVDAEQITTSVEAVRLEAQIQRIKEVKLVVDVIYAGGSTEKNTTVKVAPEVIRVSGGEAVLAEIGDTYTLCTLNLAEIETSTNGLKYTISLPEGVTNQTGVSEAQISVRFASDLRIKEFVIDNFQIVNVPEGLEAEIINANLTVKVRGPEAEISRLTEEDITAVIDFSAAEVGTATYKATITFAEGFNNMGAMKTNSVSAMVSEKE